MTKRKWLLGAAVLALVGIAFFARGFWTADKTDARAQGAANRGVPVETAKVVRKKMPVRLDALGTVTPIASVALKARVETTITAVHFVDGAHVNAGDKLFTLDCRVMDAQIQTTEGQLARDQAQLAGAERDVGRYTELVGKNQAELLFYTGRRIGGEEATRIGLANVCVPQDQVRAEATKLAAEIAESAPLAIISTRKTMRGDLADRPQLAEHDGQEVGHLVDADHRLFGRERLPAAVRDEGHIRREHRLDRAHVTGLARGEESRRQVVGREPTTLRPALPPERQVAGEDGTLQPSGGAPTRDDPLDPHARTR